MLLWLKWSLTDGSDAQVGSARSATNRRPAHREASHHYTGNRQTSKPDDRRRTFRRGRHGRRSLEDESSLASRGTKQSRADRHADTRSPSSETARPRGRRGVVCCVVHSMLPLRRIGHDPRAVHARGPRLNTHTRTIVSFSCVYSCIASRMSSPSITITVTSFLLSSVSSSCVEGDRGKGSQRDHETSGTVVIFGHAWFHRPRL